MPITTEREEHWTQGAERVLKGRTIKAVRYMTAEEARGLPGRPLILELDDGQKVWPMIDEEGNGGGVLFTTRETLPVVPVLR